jgi:hypothetical protein
MKYLIMTHPEGSVAVEPKTAAEIWKSARSWMQKMSTKGVIESHFAFPEGGGFAIMNADSPEQVFDGVFSFPAHQWFRWEVRAICDWTHAYDKTIENYTKAASH